MICALGYYSLATAGSEVSYSNAMARTTWFVGATRRKVKGSKKRMSGTVSESHCTLGTFTNEAYCRLWHERN